MEFKDLFSGHARDYAKYRPHHPRELFEFLSSISESHDCAWDCGTGNGQAAVALAPFFKKVIATDASEKQIAHAEKHERVEYRVAPAECSGLEDQSVDLITVAQAFHWFKRDDFFSEVRRVLRPEGKLAIWTYNLCAITPALDGIISHLYSDILGSYWAFERKYVENEYQGIDFPFHELPARKFEMKAEWNLEQLVGYLGTWSALKSFIQKNGTNPLEEIFPSMKKAWGAVTTREVRWPFSLRVFSPLHR